METLIEILRNNAPILILGAMAYWDLRTSIWKQAIRLTAIEQKIPTRIQE